MAAINIFGFFIGILIFFFIFILSNKSGKFYLAPIITFVIGLVVILYGFFKLGGFEGIGYGFIGVSIIMVAVLGAILLSIISKQIKKSDYSKFEKSMLLIIPFVLFASIIWTITSNDTHWIIDEGYLLIGEEPTASYYQISNISEGKKQVHIQLGTEYEGKQLEIDNIKRIGNTEITVKVADAGEEQNTFYSNWS